MYYSNDETNTKRVYFQKKNDNQTGGQPDDHFDTRFWSKAKAFLSLSFSFSLSLHCTFERNVKKSPTLN